MNEPYEDVFADRTVPRHEVSQDDVEIVEVCCGMCGGLLEYDGDGYWHKDPTLNPTDEELYPESVR